MSTPKNLISPKEFCKRNSIGRTSFYEELKSGKLRAVKLGKLTFITADEEQRWIASLSEYRPENAAA